MHKNASNTKITNPVVLFDGVCNLCNTSVRFLLAYNRKENLHFAPLQSEYAQQHLKALNLHNEDFRTVVFIENGLVFTKSTAAFEITKHLIYPWKIIYHFRFIPRKLTNWVYEIISINRYKVFGRKKDCMIPKPEWQNRFH